MVGKYANHTKHTAQHLLQTVWQALHQTRSPCAPWGAYTLTHRDKLWGVNIIKVSALCGKLPIDIIKGFPRNITKHTGRNILRHSTNPCGKPSFSLPPWGGLWGWIQSKAFASGRKVTAFSSASPVTLASAQARANKCRCKAEDVGGGYVVGTFEPPGEPLKQVLVPLSVGRGLFFIGDLSMSSTNRQKNFQKGGVKLLTVLPQ